MAQTFAPMAGVIPETVNPTIKTNCKISLYSKAVFPQLEPCGQHWGLSVALDGIAAYQNWISGWLLPIASLWIYEHLDEIREYRKLDKPDDLNELVKGAFEFARDHHYFNAEHFELDQDQHGLNCNDINPTWAGIYNELKEKIRVHCEYPNFEEILRPR